MFIPLDFSLFEERTGIRKKEFSQGWDEANVVVSLRDLEKIVRIELMPHEYLRRLLESVPLTGDPECKPYKGRKFRQVRSDPNRLRIGQNFVENKKLLAFRNEFHGKFSEFCASTGYAKRTPFLILGKTTKNDLALAHYLPPIVESRTRGDCLLDGVHRNDLARVVGTTVESIVIFHPEPDFPCNVHGWDEVMAVDEKPPKNERFDDLKPHLFRDLKAVGIDG